MSKLTLQAQQQQFANHLRDPALYGQPPGIESRRMAIYRNLFFNNIENFISSAFPIFRSLLTEDEWLMLIRDFFSQHKAQTPYFLEISEEFLDYLNNEQLALHQRFPFAQELCHYEWLELVLDVAEAEPVTQQGSVINAEGDLSSEVIILSPFIWAQAYTWPVHEIGQQNIPTEIPNVPSCLLVYRTEDFSIEFMQINMATIRLLELVDEHPELVGAEVIALLAQDLAQACSATFMQFAFDTLEKFRSLGIVLGTSPL